MTGKDRVENNPDLLVISPSDGDPDGVRLQAVIDAHSCYSRFRGWRHLWVHLLASVGALMWLGSSWPNLVPERLRELALVLWPACLIATLVIAGREWRWYRRRAGRLSGYQQRPGTPT